MISFVKSLEKYWIQFFKEMIIEMNKIDKNWKEQYKIWQEQCKIAEEIKSELLKKTETEHQRNVIKEVINAIKRKYRL